MARPRSDTPANPDSPTQSSPPVSFEEAMGELEDIVHALESEPLPLEDLVGRYERGMNLLRQCRRQIDSAQLRIEQITQRGDDAVAVTPFSASEPAIANAPN
ncbi:MAG: exodeoxyribonuclease VII small subunit, partial [Verrucomicrobiaceae bacterium]